MANTGVDSTPHPSKQIVEEGYDLIAPTYNKWTTSGPSPRPSQTKRLLELIPEKSKVLELGCGAGIPGTQILASHCSVTGNDISGAQIALARQNVPDAAFVQGDMMALTFDEGSFDAVVAFYSVIHLPREEQKVMMGKIAGWLKDGGYVLVNLGANDNEGSVNQDWLGGKMYWSSYDAETNREMVRGAGFEIVKAEVIEDDEDGKSVPFLWVLARKSGPEHWKR